MPTALLHRIALSALVFATLACYGEEAAPATADPAAAFWAVFVDRTGHYSFDIESIRGELAKVQKADYRNECEAQVAQLVKDCSARILDFEKEAISVVSLYFEREELRHLQTLFEITRISRSENGSLNISLPEENTVALSATDKDRLQGAIDSLVLSKFEKALDELFMSLDAYSSPLVDYIDKAFHARPFEILEPYEPRNAYHGPLHPSESSKVLRFYAPPLPATLAYLEQTKALTEPLVLDTADPMRRIGDRLTALITHSDGESLTQWITRIEVVLTTNRERERA